MRTGIDHSRGAIQKLLEGAGVVFKGKKCRCPFHEDHNPSAGLYEKDGVWRFKCQTCGAGGDIEDVRKLLDGRSTNTTCSNGHSPRREVCRYTYTDEAGKPLFQKIRYEPKKPNGFSLCRPDGNPGLGDVRRVLYRLPELLAADVGTMVIIAEGEKDVDNLVQLGLVATCNFDGAAESDQRPKWKPEYSPHFAHRKVCIIADKDKAGRAHAAAIALNLAEVAAEVRLVEVPGAACKDASDYISSAGATADDFRRLFESAPVYQAEVTEANTTTTRIKNYSLTDTGNAERFRDMHKGKAIYASGQWWIHDGKRFARDIINKVEQLAKETASSIYADASRHPDADTQAKLAKWAITTQSAQKREAMIKLARSEPGIAYTADQLDADPWLLNCINGMVDLRTGVLKPHDADQLITKLAQVVFDEKAKYPRFEHFITRIFGNQKDLIEYVQKLLGLALSGDISEQILPIFWGDGANGKSTLLGIVADILGDYAGIAPDSLLTTSRNQSHPTELADLCGRRFVVASETEGTARLRLQLVKRLTGEHRITARRMHKDFFEFTRTDKLFLQTNNKPRIPEDTEAAWRRIKLVPFTVVIPESERDPHLLDKLKAEKSGILNWLIQGCLAWQANGLVAPNQVVVATKEYRDESDPLADFVEECCMIESGVQTQRGQLYRAYVTYTERRGERPITQKSFAAKIRKLGCADGRSHAGRFWDGISLVYHPDLEESVSP